MLANAYHRNLRADRLAAVSALVLSFGLGVFSIVGVKSYGVAANADAVIVSRPSLLRSIPTEADTTQKTSPLSVGSVARVDNSFLGWRRIAFENGQTGWVRKDDLVPLWR